jgi:RNA polymerase-binding transcription factor DksA
MAVNKKTVKATSKTTTKKSSPAKKSTVKVTEKPTTKTASAQKGTSRPAAPAKKTAEKNAKKTDKKVATPAASAAKKAVKNGSNNAAKVTKGKAAVASTSKKVAATTTKTEMKKNESAEKKTTKAASKDEKVTKKTADAPKKTATKAPSAKEEPKKAVAADKKATEKKAVKSEPAEEVIETPAPAKVEKKKAVPAKPTKVVIPELSTKAARKYEPEFTKSVLDQPAGGISTGPTLRYSDSDLQEFKELILKKLEAAKQELSYLQGLITRKDSMGGDETENRYMTMEDGSMSMEREQLAQMASRQINYIDHLEKALMRIENKTYGVCRVTGRLIDKARLKAVPHATLSIEAKQNMNR